MGVSMADSTRRDAVPSVMRAEVATLKLDASKPDGSVGRACAALQLFDHGGADVDLVEPFDACIPPGLSALISTTLSPTTSMPTKYMPSATSFSLITSTMPRSTSPI